MISDTKNSGASQRFNNTVRTSELAVVAVTATVLVALAAAWFFSRGYLLYYGDAQAHLAISRGIVDSRSPGYLQIGNIWLPVLHVLCLPFAMNNCLWQTGLAGSIPVAICFVVAIVLFYCAAREAYGGILPAVVTVAIIALNPNLLYLSSIPMTEMVFFVGVSAQLFCLLRFRRTGSSVLAAIAGLASIWASLTRYDGWFLIPFVAAGFAFLGKQRRFGAAALFALIAALAPLYWIAHNQWATGDALDFYHGPYSAMGIAGDTYYPGKHNLRTAAVYYFTAGRLCAGWPLIAVGVAGLAAAVWKRAIIPIAFLLLTPLFYIWSIYGSGTPIHVPNLWPFTYYNTRYGIAVLPLCAFGAGAIALAVPERWRRLSLLLVAVAVLPWLLHPSHERWICWKESEQNSNSRRFWTDEVAQFLKAHYHTGEGILYWHGDVPGVFGRSGIALRESINPGDHAIFVANAYQLRFVENCKWIVVVRSKGEPLSRSIEVANWKKTAYEAVLEVRTPKDPVVQVYRRRW